jgi:hypothetical protein
MIYGQRRAKEERMSIADRSSGSSSSAPDEEVVTYPFGAPEPPPAPARRSRPVMIGGIGVAVLLAVVGAAVAVSRLADRNDLAVGDCAVLEGVAFEKADCADSAAGYVLLEIVSDTDCVEVAGAVRSVAVDGAEFCFGDKGVDPATAINGAREGDCVTLRGNDARRTPCTSSEATHIVRRRATDVPAVAVEQACAGVDDPDMSYGWSWSNVETGREPTRYDVLLCLSRH